MTPNAMNHGLLLSKDLKWTVNAPQKWRESVGYSTCLWNKCKHIEQNDVVQPISDKNYRNMMVFQVYLCLKLKNNELESMVHPASIQADF